MTRARHLAGRFLSSLRPRPLDAADVDLVDRVLDGPERACWEALGPADRAESIATARAVERALGSDAAGEPRWLAVALLHDVGKADSDLGVFGRSAATVAATLAGHRRSRAWTGAFGRYVNHDDRGAARLRQAGARAESVAWAAAHHRRELWSATGIPLEICAILATADGEPELR